MRANTYGAHGIDDGGRSLRLLAIVEPGLLAHQRPQLVQVDGGAVGCVPLQVVVSHTHLTEVPRMAEETRQNQVKNCSPVDTQKAAPSVNCDCPSGRLSYNRASW